MLRLFMFSFYIYIDYNFHSWLMHIEPYWIWFFDWETQSEAAHVSVHIVGTISINTLSWNRHKVINCYLFGFSSRWLSHDSHRHTPLAPNIMSMRYEYDWSEDAVFPLWPQYQCLKVEKEKFNYVPHKNTFPKYVLHWINAMHCAICLKGGTKSFKFQIVPLLLLSVFFHFIF